MAKSLQELRGIIGRLQMQNEWLAATNHHLQSMVPSCNDFRLRYDQEIKHYCNINLRIMTLERPVIVSAYQNSTGILKYETNLDTFTDNGRLDPSSKIQLKYVVCVYEKIANGCDISWRRVIDNGFDPEEEVYLQTAICAIYRNNGWDITWDFLSYIRSIVNPDGHVAVFFDNNCYRCARLTPEVAKNCLKLYRPELNRGRQIGEL